VNGVRASGSFTKQEESVLLRVKLIEHKTVKHIRVNGKDTVSLVRIAIAEMAGDDPAQFNLFKTPTDEDEGQWLREDYPMDFYIYNAGEDSRTQVSPIFPFSCSSTSSTITQDLPPLDFFLLFSSLSLPFSFLSSPISNGEGQLEQ
jgi:hypothetical protein